MPGVIAGLLTGVAVDSLLGAVAGLSLGVILGSLLDVTADQLLGVVAVLSLGALQCH